MSIYAIRKSDLDEELREVVIKFWVEKGKAASRAINSALIDELYAVNTVNEDDCHQKRKIMEAEYTYCKAQLGEVK